MKPPRPARPFSQRQILKLAADRDIRVGSPASLLPRVASASEVYAASPPQSFRPTPTRCPSAVLFRPPMRCGGSSFGRSFSPPLGPLLPYASRLPLCGAAARPLSMATTCPLPSVPYASRLLAPTQSPAQDHDTLSFFMEDV
ncbi:hypothetical protein DAI22_04g284990 [Oryza sativa Japonica Group]|nr:hypothetical protein DAI22_04g284990 [Oryza sativa Japonica Group]